MEAIASVYKSVWQALETVKKDATSLVGERDKLLGSIGPSKPAEVPRTTGLNTKMQPQPVQQPSAQKSGSAGFEDLENMEIPQERTIGYDSGRYNMGGIDHRPSPSPQQAMPLSMENPRVFKSVGKLSNTEGWLLVQSHKNLSEWRVDWNNRQRKYVMLYDKLLFIFDEDKLHLRVPKAMLNFDQQSFVLDTPAKQSPEFRIQDAEKYTSFGFRADSLTQKDLWVNFINTHLAASCGVTMRLGRLYRLMSYWRKFEITHEQMAAMVEHGDVLLFKNERTIAAVQRFLTSSEYDHVGLLVRSQDGQVIVLEAAGNTGVECTPWNDFISKRWYKLYSK